MPEQALYILAVFDCNDPIAEPLAYETLEEALAEYHKVLLPHPVTLTKLTPQGAEDITPRGWVKA